MSETILTMKLYRSLFQLFLFQGINCELSETKRKKATNKTKQSNSRVDGRPWVIVYGQKLSNAAFGSSTLFLAPAFDSLLTLATNNFPKAQSTFPWEEKVVYTYRRAGDSYQDTIPLGFTYERAFMIRHLLIQ